MSFTMLDCIDLGSTEDCFFGSVFTVFLGPVHAVPLCVRHAESPMSLTSLIGYKHIVFLVFLVRPAAVC